MPSQIKHTSLDPILRRMEILQYGQIGEGSAILYAFGGVEKRLYCAVRAVHAVI